MKLPTNQMQALKLQKVTPLKRSLNRLSKAPLFRGVHSVKQSKGVKIALNLLLVRPWVLVVGFWLLSMVGGTLALDGMLSPRKLKMALPEPPTVEVPVATSQIQVTPDSDELSAEASDESEVTAEQPEVISIGTGSGSADEGAGFPLLPLTILVGGCATGCLVMSRRRAMARMSAARARGRTRVRKSNPVRAGQSLRKPASQNSNVANATAKTMERPATVATTAPAPKSKKRRQRVRKGAVAKTAVAKTAAAKTTSGSNRVLASRATAKPETAKSRTAQVRAAQPRNAQTQTAQARPSQARASRRQVRRASARVASRRQPMVSVVPANESHSLDWHNGSLAHQMDVRQRSAM